MPPASTFQAIGAMISGCALLTAATTGIVGVLIFNRRQVQDAWVERFRKLYAEFWHDETMSEVRKWVLNDTIFLEKAPIFDKRNTMDKCNVSRVEHEILEDFDKFCALLLRSRSFTGARMTKRQKMLWTKLLGGDFWIGKIKERPELHSYVEKHWKELIA